MNNIYHIQKWSLQNRYTFYFRKTYLVKLGLKEIKDGDEKFVEDLLEMMQMKMADFTATFRQLAEVTLLYIRCYTFL